MTRMLMSRGSQARPMLDLDNIRKLYEMQAGIERACSPVPVGSTWELAEDSRIIEELAKADGIEDQIPRRVIVVGSNQRRTWLGTSGAPVEFRDAQDPTGKVLSTRFFRSLFKEWRPSSWDRLLEEDP